MDRTEILTKLRPLFCDIFDIDESAVTENATVDDIPDWDSLNQIVLIASIEEEFSIHFSMDDYAEMKGVRRILDYIEAHI